MYRADLQQSGRRLDQSLAETVPEPTCVPRGRNLLVLGPDLECALDVGPEHDVKLSRFHPHRTAEGTQIRVN
jgi:hypothetical protein